MASMASTMSAVSTILGAVSSPDTPQNVAIGPIAPTTINEMFSQTNATINSNAYAERWGIYVSKAGAEPHQMGFSQHLYFDLVIESWMTWNEIADFDGSGNTITEIFWSKIEAVLTALTSATNWRLPASGVDQVLRHERVQMDSWTIDPASGLQHATIIIPDCELPLD